MPHGGHTELLGSISPGPNCYASAMGPKLWHRIRGVGVREPRIAEEGSSRCDEPNGHCVRRTTRLTVRALIPEYEPLP